MVDVGFLLRNVIVPTGITLITAWAFNQLKEEKAREIFLSAMIGIAISSIVSSIQTTGARQIVVGGEEVISVA